jgi:translation initiation factor 2B subunit (eIF-2B alpha/beta/delta family)
MLPDLSVPSQPVSAGPVPLNAEQVLEKLRGLSEPAAVTVITRHMRRLIDTLHLATPVTATLQAAIDTFDSVLRQVSESQTVDHNAEQHIDALVPLLVGNAPLVEAGLSLGIGWKALVRGGDKRTRYRIRLVEQVRLFVLAHWFERLDSLDRNLADDLAVFELDTHSNRRFEPIWMEASPCAPTLAGGSPASATLTGNENSGKIGSALPATLETAESPAGPPERKRGKRSREQTLGEEEIQRHAEETRKKIEYLTLVTTKRAEHKENATRDLELLLTESVGREFTAEELPLARQLVIDINALSTLAGAHLYLDNRIVSLHCTRTNPTKRPSFTLYFQGSGKQVAYGSVIFPRIELKTP